MKYFLSILFIALISNILSAKDLIIYLTPAISSSKNNIFFEDYLNYGIINVNNATLKPQMNFTFDFKPAFHVSARYDAFALKYGLYVKNDLIPIESLQPLANRYDGSGNISRYYTYDENHTKVNTPYKVQYHLINYAFTASLSYRLSKSVEFSLNYSNLYLTTNKKSVFHKETFDSLSVDFEEKINRYGLGAAYHCTLQKVNITLQANIFPLQDWIVSYNILEKKINKGYSGAMAWNAGFKVFWKSFFLAYKYIYSATDQNKYAVNTHLIEFGFTWEILRLDVSKLDLFY